MPIVNYLWNPLNDNIVREFDDAGAVIAEYTTEANQFGNVVSQRRGGQDSVYHYDGLGSTLALTNANGDVTDTYAYSAFGEVTAHTGSTANPFQYVGQKQYHRDAETDGYDIRHRPLLPQGRWLSADPFNILVRLSQSPMDWHSMSGRDDSQVSTHAENLYVYALNSPQNGLDPSGLQVAKTGAYRACLAACDATFPRWYQWIAREQCKRACGQTARTIGGVPAMSLPFGYGHYCGPTRFAPCSAVDSFTGIPVPWDELDLACAEHDCCLYSPSEFCNIFRQHKCNRALCNVAYRELLRGCENSMTPDDCQAYAGVILASPFCSLLVVGGLTPVPFPGHEEW